MRSPLYMNIDLLKNMADYYNVPVPEDAQVTRKTVDTKSRNLAIEKVVKAGVGTSDAAELTEVFETRLRPVRLLNDVIDQLLQQDLITDLTQKPDAEIIHREPVMFEGEIELSGVAKLASFISPMIPSFIAQAQRGVQEFEFDPGDFLAKLTSTEPSSEPQVLLGHVAGRDERFIMIVQPGYIVGDDRSIEDILGEQNVFGLTERVVRAGRSYPLERYLLPGLSRNIRRLIPANKFNELIEKIPEQIRGDMDEADLAISGPAFIIDTAAIYS